MRTRMRMRLAGPGRAYPAASGRDTRAVLQLLVFVLLVMLLAATVPPPVPVVAVPATAGASAALAAPPCLIQHRAHRSAGALCA